METTQVEVKDQAVELSAEAFKLFCDDIADMFNLEIECVQAEICQENLETLKKRFEKLVAVSSVKAEGILHGTFQIVFDQGGLFTLSGVIVMMPEGKILEDIQHGSIEQAEQARDHIAEVANLLIGAWDRVFQEDLDGHGHFTQTNTFIGSLRDNPEAGIALPADEELVFVPYQITINPYPPFNCGVILPPKIFDAVPESDSGHSVPTEQTETEEQTNQQIEERVKEETKTENKKDTREDTKEQQQVSAEQSKDNTKANESVTESETPAATERKQGEPTEAKDIEETDQETGTEKIDAKEETNLEAETKEQAVSADKVESTEKEPTNEEINDADESTAEQEPTGPTEPTESEEQPVSETVQETTPSATVLPTENTGAALAMCAKDIMEKDVLWGSADDSVQQTLTKMQQADVGYMLVGQDGQAEGIVSKSDLTGAISPYLRPVFAKWHRPQDDASLQIKVKWIMSRPVRTIRPETSLPTIMEDMSQFGGRCLPVMDQQGNIQGLVTVFDIFKALLKSNWNITTTGKAPQSPPLA